MIIEDPARASKLVTLKETLYGGSWEAMEKELSEQRFSASDSLGDIATTDLELVRVLKRIEQSGKSVKEVITEELIKATQGE